MNYRKCIGKRIKRIRLRPFPDGRGGRAYDPIIELDDGTRIQFYVQETDVGEYGVELDVIRTKLSPST